MKVEDIVTEFFVAYSSCYLLYYTIVNIKRIFDAEIGVTVSTEPIDDNFILPFATLCPRFHTSVPVGEEETVFDNVTFAQAMSNGYEDKYITPLIKNMAVAKLYRFHHEGAKIGNLMFEPCYTFLETVEFNTAKVYFNMSSVVDVYLIFHRDLGHASTLLNINGDQQTYFSSQARKSGDISKKIYLEVEVMKKVREPHKQYCSPDIEQSQKNDRCYENHLADLVGCQLPWSSNGAGTECKSSDELKKLAKAMLQIQSMTPTEMRKYLTEIGCQIPCKYEHYNTKIFLENTTMAKNPLADVNLFIDIILKKVDIRVETEFVVYDTISFLADIGGFTGFLLGYSILSVYDFLLDIASKLAEVLKIKHSLRP